MEKITVSLLNSALNFPGFDLPRLEPQNEVVEEAVVSDDIGFFRFPRIFFRLMDETTLFPSSQLGLELAEVFFG